jgi:hypothetical protein
MIVRIVTKLRVRIFPPVPGERTASSIRDTRLSCALDSATIGS